MLNNITNIATASIIAVNGKSVAVTTAIQNVMNIAAASIRAAIAVSVMRTNVCFATVLG